MRRLTLKIAAGIFGLVILLFLDAWILGSLAALVLDMAHTFPPDLAGWRDVWLDQPVEAASRMLWPAEEEDTIRGFWLSMQPLLVAGLCFLDWHLWQWSRRPKKAPADASGYGSLRVNLLIPLSTPEECDSSAWSNGKVEATVSAGICQECAGPLPAPLIRSRPPPPPRGPESRCSLVPSGLL